MGHVKSAKPLTANSFLNLYELEAVSKTGRELKYFVSTRAKTMDQMKLKSRRNNPDGVIIYSLYGEKKDRVVLVRQYRYAIDDYIYEFPAGLVEPEEDFRAAGIREMKEETGLDFTPIQADMSYERPYFTTIGMTDESCATVYGYAEGEISRNGLEDSEELEIILADREEVKRILKEENVAIVCSYMLMHFLHDKQDTFAFLTER